MASSSSEGLPSGPTSSRRGRSGPFGELVARAAGDPDAAEALACAYGELSPQERRHLIPLVVGDAARHGVEAAPVLAVLLGHEDDAEVAGVLADHLRRSGGAGLAPCSTSEAWLTGDTQHGSAALAQPLHTEFVEVLALGWGSEGLEARHEPMVRQEEVADTVERMAFQPKPPRADLRIAIDTLALVLWRHRGLRHHAWPGPVARFAGLFDPPSALVGW